jgi:DNA-binding NtrC family response regulator
VEFSIVQFGSNASSDLSKLQQSLHVAGHHASIDGDQTASDSDLLISKTDCKLVCIAGEWISERASLQVLMANMNVNKSIFIIPHNDVELARHLGSLGCSHILAFPASGDTDHTWSGLVVSIIAIGAAIALLPASENARNAVIFSDPKSKSMLALIERVAKVDVTALLTGESGVGKEVVARTLHAMSPRSRRPFVALNCAAIPENLVESILFGHIKGSFTGAVRDQAGIFEQADGGTLFLDEIGELPIDIQPKLLRVLQERTSAATNQSLSDLVRDRLFREDLFYRISTFHINIPSLRERPEDIKQIARHCASSTRFAGTACAISESAIARLQSYRWPGNVRELENVICRAKVFATDNFIDQQDIIFDAVESLGSATSIQKPEDLTSDVVKDSHEVNLSVAKEEAEIGAIFKAIETTKSREEAARVLGISSRTLRYKVKKFKESHGQGSEEILGVGRI